MLSTDIDARRLVAAERRAQLARDAWCVPATGRQGFALRRSAPTVASNAAAPKLRTLARILAVLAPFAVAAVLALPAAATEPQAQRLDLAGHITGPNSIAGTWTATGAVTDGGTVHRDVPLRG